MLCTYLLVYLGIYCLVTPYEIYDKLNFNIPVGRHGDCYDRYLIRVAEMRESLKIIQQCIKEMPKTGPIKVKNAKLFPPTRDSMKFYMENLIQSF